MRKSTIVRSWIAGLVLLAAGLLVVGLSVGVMLAYGGHFAPAAFGNNYDFVPAFDGVFWTTTTLIALGSVAAFAGWVIQLVAWVGAVINTHRLADKSWFTILLIGGLVGVIFAPVGFAVMVAYLMGGPDGMAIQQPPAQRLVARPSAVAPTS